MSDDYIPVLDAANALKMSPGRFAALLRKEREKLPVEINYELVNQLEDYHTQQGCSFKINIDKLKTIYDEDFAMLGFFPVLMIHRLDWNAFLSGRKEEQEFIAPSHYELEKAQARIAELETELAACQKQLEEARRDISGKEGHEPAHSEDFPAEYEEHGIFTMVAKLVEERAPVEDIMRLLADEKDFLSNREDGYFFHPSPEGKAASTLRNYIKNRLNKKGVNS